jgi:copper chaperone CopZ
MKTVARYRVTGMTCDHCVKSVTTELKKIGAVRRVKVELAPEGVSTVAVTSSAAISPREVESAIEEAGYEVAGAA